MGVADQFPALWSDLSPWITQRLKDAAALRDTGDLFTDTAPKMLVDTLVDVRSRVDRLEQITADLGRLKARAEMAVNEAQDAYDDAFAQSVKSSATAEFATAKEKDSTHMAASLDQLIVLRKAKRRQESVVEAYEYVRMLHKGLDGIRWDISVVLNGVTLDMKLDR